MGKSVELLSREQVCSYINQYKAGDVNARNIVIEHNIGLARRIVKKYFPKAPYEEDELITVGLLRLMEKLDQFDMARELQFSSWAAVVIKNAINGYLTVSQKYRLDSLDAIIDVELSRDDETQPFDVNGVLVSEMNYYNSKSKELDEEEKYRRELDYSIVSDYGITKLDTLCDAAPDFTLRYEKGIDASMLDCFYEFLFTLSDRKRKIMILYFGLFGTTPHTMEEIGIILGTSRQNISVIFYRILKSFRDKIKCSEPVDFSLHKIRRSKN